MRRFPLALAALVGATLFAAVSRPATAQAPTAERAALDSAFTRQEVMMPMRDGVRLFTVILTPRRARSAGALPIILSRTPYGTNNWGGTSGILYGFRELMDDGYVFAFQDIRGRHASEGAYVMNHPPQDHRNPKAIDESTDAYDTIDWLVKHVPNNNGRVGELGISYPGWLTNMATIDPHPALKAVSPQATMGDGWVGDDFFHNGAFRLSVGLEYAWQMEASSDESIVPSPARYDTYDWYRAFPTLTALGRSIGAERWPSWRMFAAHPTYDTTWQARAVTRVLTHTTVPTLTVGGFWDQEDVYGPQATYRTLERTDSARINHIVLGPWYHGEWFIEAGDSLGNIHFGSPTGAEFRRNLEAKWFAHYLHGTGDGRFAEATVYDAGARQWRTYDRWPAPGARPVKLYLHAGGRLSMDAPTTNEPADVFVSDPAHPVPYRPRPVEWEYDPRGSRWTRWRTEDQRFVEGRPDVLTWQTARLDRDMTVAGDVTARLFASTTGSDADWVVKLIDVYPDSVADRPAMGGYELMVSSEITRGRYRASREHPAALTPNAMLAYTVDLHQQAYTFKAGHRMMVQVQSTWFPLYDRNPQTFVPNIFHARAEDYQAQTHRVAHTPATPSHVEVLALP